MIQFKKLMQGLYQYRVDFILIGGMAGVVHGSSHVTSDLDICYGRESKNLKSLARLLKQLKARLRGVDPQLPFILDEKTLNLGMNFTLETKWGPLDLIGEVPGLGMYQDILPHIEIFDLYTFPVKVLSLNSLILAKQATARPKDLNHLQELKALASLKRK